MNPPPVYRVRPEQVGGGDVSEFLRSAIAKQFDGKQYIIATEQTIDRTTPYSMTPRKLRAFGIQESNGHQHTIYFDVTDVSFAASVNWLGNHRS